MLCNFFESVDLNNISDSSNHFFMRLFMSKLLDLLSNEKTYSQYLKEMAKQTNKLEPLTVNKIRFFKTFDQFKKDFINSPMIHFNDLPGLFFLLNPCLNGSQHYELCKEELDNTFYKFVDKKLEIFTKLKSGNYIKTFESTIDMTDVV